jgi:NADH-quinone oxidoreductase subunit E
MTCALTCWGIAALAGFLSMVGLMLMGDWMFIQGAFVGAIVFVALGAVLSKLMCSPLAPINAGAARQAASPARPAAAPKATAEPKPAASAAPKSSQLAGEQELAGRKSEWRYGGEGGSGAKPATLKAARSGGADDLKLLKGVGPKLEEKLNDLGFYHFDQIAAWTADQVAWVDDQLKFKGRIERDGWIEQARILAAGGETEFSKRNK